MAASTQQKLAKIFPEQFQIKRLSKQIGDLKDLREKGSFDIKMTVLRNQCLNFKIELLPLSYKGTKLPQNLTKIPQQVKIVVRKNYPAHPPKMFFMNDNMTKYGLRPFRDYFSQFLPQLGDNQWSAKFTITQMVKSLPAFFERCLVDKQITQVFKAPSFQDHFEIDNLYSWKFCQVHPIKLLKKGTSKQGFMFIDINKSEIMLLEDIGVEASYSTCDYFRGHQILSLRKKKNTSNRFLLQIKLNYPGLSGKYGIEFSTQDYEALAIAIMDCAKIGEPDKKMPENEVKKQQTSSEQEEMFSDNIEDGDQSRKNSMADEVPTNINEIIEGIIVYESLVDNKMTSQNISQLVSLLQKAIQHYSAHGDEKFQIYLTKLQNILSNEMSQALLQSANQEKKKGKKASPQSPHSKQQYQSIVDLL